MSKKCTSQRITNNAGFIDAPCTSLNSFMAPSNTARAVFQRNSIWPQNSTVRISCLNGADWQRAWVEKVIISTFQPLINLNLVFIQQSTQHADITIKFVPTFEANSFIGTQSMSKKPSMKLGWLDAPAGSTFEWKGVVYKVPPNIPKSVDAFTTGAVIMHEFGHALGMLHEHNNPRGLKIQWNPEEVYKYYCPLGISWEMIKYNVMNELDTVSTNGSEFDEHSIMIYAFPGKLTYNYPQGTKANATLSSLDKEWLSRMYPRNKPERYTEHGDYCSIQ